MKLKKIKVGILTFHYSYYNYGAVLQAYSIYQVINMLGYEPYLINYLPRNLSFKSNLLFILQKLVGFQFDVFRKQYLPNILNKTLETDELKKLNNYLDCFVVGSDQVWRYRENNIQLYRYFLDFVDDKKIKVSYAASFGTDYWEGNEEVTQQVGKLLKRFNSISVREDSGCKILKNIMKVKATKVLDPTLILDRKYFYEISERTSINNLATNSYMAYMLLDDSVQYEHHFKNMASNNAVKFIKIIGILLLAKKNLILFNNISKWLFYIRHAEIVITDSFHCVVFSIIFRKKFACIANKKRGATRLKNLLQIIGLESRLFTSLNQIDENLIFSEDIDYKQITKIIEKEKNRSIEFLKNSLPAV